MRSAACLLVIRLRHFGQYLTLFDFDAKEAPHSVHFYRNVFSVVPKSKVKIVAKVLKTIHTYESKKATCVSVH